MTEKESELETRLREDEDVLVRTSLIFIFFGGGAEGFESQEKERKPTGHREHSAPGPGLPGRLSILPSCKSMAAASRVSCQSCLEIARAPLQRKGPGVMLLSSWHGCWYHVFHVFHGCCMFWRCTMLGQLYIYIYMLNLIDVSTRF